MGQIILHILCEGQTEERFVKSVLRPFLEARKVIVKPIVLSTNRGKGAFGGSVSFVQFENDLKLAVSQNSNDSYNKHFYSMMVDFYRIPNDFPGYEKCITIQDHSKAVVCLENELRDYFKKDIFIPYIQLHEFESLVFCGLAELSNDYPKVKKKLMILERELQKLDNQPERVNNGENTAPSKRLKNAFGKEYRYNKPHIGESVTKSIGIDTLKARCPHFSDWIETLEKLQHTNIVK